MTTPIGIKMTLDGQREVSQGLQQVGRDVGQLGNAGTQLGGLSQGMGKAALTAGQLQQATQQLPLQFQDIVVSLQAGQQPLTVMLQQGSQLAGSFGGIGAAAKAMAGYVVGLVNPLTLLAAGVATVGVAYYQGSQEQDAWVRGIVTTGNASGVTTAQLREYARAIDGVVGTQRQAAAGLADFVDAGVRGGDELRRYTEAAVVWERATGQAVSTTAKQFSDLQGAPLEAVLKLNQGTNFLTVSVYEQIKSLDSQGRSAEASRVAMDALESSMRDRARQIEESLGYVERGWRAIKDAASEGWDAMLGVGRKRTNRDLLKDPQQELDTRQSRTNVLGDDEAMRRGNAVLMARIALVTDLVAQEDLNAAAQAESARLMRARESFDNKYSKALDGEVTLQQKLAKARAEAEAAGKSEADTKKVLAFVTEEHNKSLSKGGAAAKQAQTSYESLLSTINQKIVAMQNEVTAGQKLTETERLRAKLQEELDTKGRQYSARQRADLEARLQVLDAVEKQAIAAKTLAKANEDDAKSLERLTQQRENSLKSTQQALRAAQDEEEAARLAAASNISNGQAVAMVAAARAEDAYMQAVASGEAPRTLDFLEKEMQARRKLVEVMGQRGVREANKKSQEQIARDWEKMSRTVGDTLADYIMGGGKDAAQYLKRLFATLVLQPVVQYGVSGVMGAMGFGGQSAAGGTGAAGLVQNGHSLYSAFSGGLTGTLGTAMAGLGVTFGSTAATAFGSGIIAGGNLGLFGGGIGQGMAAISGGSTAAGLGTIAGAALPWVAGGLALASLFGSGAFSSRGANHSGGAYSTTGNGAYGLGLTGNALGDFTSRGNAEIASSVKTLVTSTVDAFDYLGKYANDTFKGVDIAAGFAVNGRHSDEDAYAYFRLIDKATGGVLANYQQRDGGLGSNPDAAWSKFSADLLTAVYGQFMKADLTGWVRDEMATIDGKVTFENLAAAAQKIATIDAAFAGWGKTIDGMLDLSGSVQTTLLRVSGGFDALAAGVNSFYAGYYSDAERAEDQLAALAEVFAKYGAVLPATREQYRALVEQQLAAGDAGAEFAAVLLGLNQQFGSVADFVSKELGSMSGSVKGFFADFRGGLDALVADVASARKAILRGTGVLSAEEIASQIAGAAITAPGTAGVAAAAGNVAEKSAAVAAAKAASDAAAEQAKAALAAWTATHDDPQSAAAKLAAAQQRKQHALSEAGKFEDGGELRDRSYSTRVYWMNYWYPKAAEAQREIDALQPALQAYQDSLAGLDGQYKSAQISAEAYAAALAASKEALAAAQAAQASALTDYAAEMSKYVSDAGGSIDKLSDLRGEVMSFYEAQVQAVQGMLQSAGNLRSVVDQVRLGQLTTAQTAAELGNRYAMDYSMAMATTGAARAGYVDSMAGNLQGLSEALKAEAATGADWRIQTAKLLAQASNAAGLLEGDAKDDDYKDVALGLLGNIDSALTNLAGTTKSAEQVIADAINNGTQAQLGGLRAIVAALKGESIPAFAVGTNYVPRDMLAQIHEGEAIVPKAFNPWAGGGMPTGGAVGSARMERLLQQLIDERRVQASRQVDLQLQLNKLMQRWDAMGMPEPRELTA